jgi:hypothetical protein
METRNPISFEQEKEEKEEVEEEINLPQPALR